MSFILRIPLTNANNAAKNAPSSTYVQMRPSVITLVSHKIPIAPTTTATAANPYSHGVIPLIYFHPYPQLIQKLFNAYWCGPPQRWYGVTHERLVHSGFKFFQAEDGIRDLIVTGVQTCALPIYTRKNFLPSAKIVKFH